MRHTELPLRAVREDAENCLVNPDDWIIAKINGKADAEFIVKACNNYYQLLEIAKAVADGNFNQADIIAKARQIIANAKE